MTIVEFLDARYDEIEWWAVEASRRDGDGHTPTGEHWHWECNQDHPVSLDPLTSEILSCAEGDWNVSLRSDEEYPTQSVGPLPHFALPSVEEIPTVVAGHIVRHDPASVLADLASKRAILEWHKRWPVLVETEPKFEQIDEGGLSSYAFRMSKQIQWQTEQEYRNRFGSEPPTAPILRLLAQPFADHPDYDPAWAVKS